MKKWLSLIFCLFLLTGCGEKKGTITNIECNQVDELVNDGAVLIDVRNISEYESYHLDGAINIEYDVIGGIIDSKVDSKDTKIIVYCKSGVRSNKAATTLIEKGYKNVYDLGAYGKCVEQ